MSNPLTGNFDAVIEVNVRQINSILAEMHQRRVVPDASPSFPHASRVRYGKLPERLRPDRVRLVDWLGTLNPTWKRSHDSALGPFPPKPTPGMRGLYVRAVSDLVAAVRAPVPPETVGGSADVQISAPWISLEDGTTSAVTIKVEIRAHCAPDPGAVALPEPIHGEVHAVYRAQTQPVDDHLVLHVEVPSEDDEIEFVPAAGTGLSASGAEQIAAEIRRALREDFAPLDVDLPAGFPFTEFKALGTGSAQAVALPLSLPGGHGGGGIGSVTNLFAGQNDFAIAVSREYVQQFLDTMVAQLKKAAEGFSSENWYGDYRVEVSFINVVWKPGAIEVNGKIRLVTDGIFAPNGEIAFAQNLSLTLDIPSQNVSLRADGDPSVNESWWIPHSSAVNTIKQIRDSALVSAGGIFTQTFTDARTRLTNGLRNFSPGARATYFNLQLGPDGIVLGGTIRTSSRVNPVVDFTETAGGAALTAIESWIPAGQIDTYKWSWIPTTHPIAWQNTPERLEQEHTFFLPKTPSIASASQICLAISGHRMSSAAHNEPADAGGSCGRIVQGPVLVFPEWEIEVPVPCWGEQPVEDVPLVDMIDGLINMAGQPLSSEGRTVNTVVHFAGGGWERPLSRLGEAFTQARRPQMPLVLILVLPTGSFQMRRSEVEARLGTLGESFRGRMFITEDFRGGWSQAFETREGPATFLLNACGEFTWHQHGALDIAGAADGLRRHLLPAPAPRFSMLRLTVRPGDLAPDATFLGERANGKALRRLRGHPVVLLFWKSWSPPCLRELRRLEELHRSKSEDRPVVLAVHGGEDREALAQVRERLGLTLPFFIDVEQRIASLYGVRCWPTTVSINREGIIDHILFGAAHAHESPTRPPAAS
jgi:peroxiredoxin